MVMTLLVRILTFLPISRYLHSYILLVNTRPLPDLKIETKQMNTYN